MNENLMLALGVCGAVLSAVIALPQAVRAWRVGVAGVSLLTYQIGFAGGVAWTAYGVAFGLWELAVGNLIFGGCSLAVLLRIWRENGSVWLTARGAVGASLLVAVAGLLDPSWFGWTAGVLSVGLRIPQLRLVFVAASIHGVSLGTWLVGVFTNVVWLTYGIIGNDPRLMIVCAVNTVTTICIIVGLAVRRRSSAIDKTEELGVVQA